MYSGFVRAFCKKRKGYLPCPTRPWCLPCSFGVAGLNLSHHSATPFPFFSFFSFIEFSLWLSSHLLSASLPLSTEKSHCWTSTLFFFFDCFLSATQIPLFSLTHFSLFPHSIIHSSSRASLSLTPTLICPYFALLISFAVLVYIQIARSLQCGFSHLGPRCSNARWSL